MRDVGIQRIMTPDPMAIGPEDAVMVARELMRENDIHHLPVTDAGRLVGIVSSTDLYKFFLMDDSAQTISGIVVRSIMNTDPVFLTTDANLRDAATRLSVGGFHALPVIEPDGTLVGIVTSSDLIEQLLRQIPRGDGSIGSNNEPSARAGLDEDMISAVIIEAERMEKDGAAHAAAKVVLHLRNRNRTLLAVCQAAELYMRSGHGEHEHSVLMKRLADARNTDDQPNL